MSRFKLLDAQAALGFVVSQTTYIERQVNEIVYPDIQYPQLIHRVMGELDRLLGNEPRKP
ncbi:TPA: hypothetical protein ACPWPV_003028 [Pseudomonas aeruginosa]